MKILTVVGARPQFIKAAAVSRAVTAYNAACGKKLLRDEIVHTGQHFDANMSRIFFEELAIPEPKYNLGIAGGSHGEMTGRMLAALERVILDEQPQVVVVYGDTNSTLAGALAAAKLQVPIAHVEAGLRSFNRRMPEEINRVVTDVLAAILLCPTDGAVANLAAEGMTRSVHQVGDVMYDSVLHYATAAQHSSLALHRLGLDAGAYYLATVHRAENTDNPSRLRGILEALSRAGRPVIFPMHPRTRQLLGSDGEVIGPPVRVIAPVSYLDMLALERHARVILTDSGGVQKEAFWFAVPCITLRSETEWAELVQAGWNRVVGTDPPGIVAAMAWAEAMDRATARPSFYGDGHAAQRIVSVLLKHAEV